MTKIAAGIILIDNKVLICQRKKDAYYELKWEFPGGKIEPNETIEECLAREIKEELNIIVKIDKVFYVQKFKYPDGFEFEIFFYLINNIQGEIINLVFENILWAEIEELRNYDFLEADKEVIKLLLLFNI